MTTATIDTTELASRLRLGVTRLARKLRQEAEPGISPSQLVALSTIERAGPMTMGELCAAEQVQPPSMTRTVAGLVEAGLVTRDVDPTDRRVAWLSVTPDGAKLLTRSRRRKEEYLARELRRLEPRELATLDRAAEILTRLVGGGR
ncbi:MAG TPA: MarR family transcriptional regulator [Actinomycetota bacterium]|nr:MarR family transcriptional regulator [Actinomycetota bacterium]